MSSSPSSFEVRVGSRIWLDGQGWEVAELDGAAVRLRSADTVRTVSLSTLAQVTIDHPEPDQPSAAPGAWEIPAIVLAGLTRAQRESLTARLVALRRVLEPDLDDGRPILQRYGDEAAALGVSRRTLQGRYLSFGERRIALGLARGESVRSLANRPSRNVSTISREIARNRNPARPCASGASPAHLLGGMT